MLLTLYPRVHRRYTSLAVLGPILNGFGTWLLKRGYATDCVREHFCAARRLTRILEQRGIRSLARLTRARLRACAPPNRLDDRRLTATVRLLERYFESETSLYPAVKRFLEAAGFCVKGEVNGCDAVAVHEGETLRLAIVEMKLGFNLDPRELVPGVLERRTVLHISIGQAF